jgi:hypothetical protein
VIIAGYPPGTLFHPTFLYEALWNLALAGGLVLIERKKKLYRGELFTLYVLGYAIGRLWVESLRIDPASEIFGVRINIWMAIIVALVALIVFSTRRFRTHPDDALAPDGPAGATDGVADEARDDTSAGQAAPPAVGHAEPGSDEPTTGDVPASATVDPQSDEHSPGGPPP